MVRLKIGSRIWKKICFQLVSGLLDHLDLVRLPEDDVWQAEIAVPWQNPESKLISFIRGYREVAYVTRFIFFR